MENGMMKPMKPEEPEEPMKPEDLMMGLMNRYGPRTSGPEFAQSCKAQAAAIRAQRGPEGEQEFWEYIADELAERKKFQEAVKKLEEGDDTEARSYLKEKLADILLRIARCEHHIEEQARTTSVPDEADQADDESVGSGWESCYGAEEDLEQYREDARELQEVLA